MWLGSVEDAKYTHVYFMTNVFITVLDSTWAATGTVSWSVTRQGREVNHHRVPGVLVCQRGSSGIFRSPPPERRAPSGHRRSRRPTRSLSYQMPQQTPDVHLLDGSVTQAPPAAVLRQAAYERRAAERHSADWAEDVASTMDVSRFEDGSSRILKGGVQLIGKVPLVVHLYREHFLRKYHQAPTPLHLDATGSVTRQVTGRSNRISMPSSPRARRQRPEATRWHTSSRRAIPFPQSRTSSPSWRTATRW